MPRKKKGALPSGSFRVQVLDYTDSDGKRHYQSFTASTRAEAEAMRDDWLQNRRQLKEKLTVSAAVARYIDMKEAVLSPSTIKNYRAYAKLYFSGAFGKIDLKKITSTDLQLWVSDLSRSLSPKSVSNASNLMSAVLDMFLPDFRMHVTLPARQKIELHCPDAGEVMSLYEAAKSPELRIAILLGACSMRRGEVCAVEYSDLKGDMLRVNKAYVEDSEKNWILKSPKTYDSTRTIQLPGFVVDAIKGMPGDRSGRICPITPQVLSERFRKVMAAHVKAGGVRFRFHDLRHFYASFMASRGYSDIYVGAAGGWRPGSSVLKRTYQNVISIEKTRTNKAMADDLGKAFSR